MATRWRKLGAALLDMALDNNAGKLDAGYIVNRTLLICDSNCILVPPHGAMNIGRRIPLINGVVSNELKSPDFSFTCAYAYAPTRSAAALHSVWRVSFSASSMPRKLRLTR